MGVLSTTKGKARRGKAMPYYNVDARCGAREDAQCSLPALRSASGETSAFAGFPEGPQPRGFHLLVEARGVQQGFDLGAGLARTNRRGAFSDAKCGDGHDGRIVLEVRNFNLVGPANSGGGIEYGAGWRLNGGERGHAFHKEIEIVGSQRGAENIMTGPQRFDGFHGFSQTGFNVMSSVQQVPGHPAASGMENDCSASAIELRAVRAYVRPGTGHTLLIT